MVEKLEISAEQADKIATTSAEANRNLRTRMRELFQAGNMEAMREEMTKARDQMNAAVLALLSDDQKARFEEMQGAAFDLPAPRGFGRGGGAAGGNRPARPSRPPVEG